MNIADKGWVACTCSGNAFRDGRVDCQIHAGDDDGSKIAMFECLVVGDAEVGDADNPSKGELAVVELECTSPGHAFTEAWHEYEGHCVAVRRNGEWRPNV